MKEEENSKMMNERRSIHSFTHWCNVLTTEHTGVFDLLKYKKYNKDLAQDRSETLFTVSVNGNPSKMKLNEMPLDQKWLPEAQESSSFLGMMSFPSVRIHLYPAPSCVARQNTTHLSLDNEAQMWYSSGYPGPYQLILDRAIQYPELCCLLYLSQCPGDFLELK